MKPDQDAVKNTSGQISWFLIDEEDDNLILSTGAFRFFLDVPCAVTSDAKPGRHK